MAQEDSHLTDQELLLAADGELAGRAAGRARLHLASCWACRTRMGELEGTIADFVQMQRGQLDVGLPPAAGPRALLRARLALAAGEGQNAWRRHLAYGGMVLAGITLAVVLATHRRQEPAAVPRASLTPGATRAVSVGDVCAEAPAGSARAIPVSLKRRVFEEYGIPDARLESYEVDYLITPELGGADDLRNLWPEPYSATAWNAHVKDALEDHLHRLVSEGKLDLATAQRDISSDWISAYKKYFRTDWPLEDHRMIR